MRAYYRYTTARTGRSILPKTKPPVQPEVLLFRGDDRPFGAGLHAVRADQSALAVNFRILQVGVLARGRGRIVVAAQKNALAAHLGSFAA
jgi:hypothetical protein